MNHKPPKIEEIFDNAVTALRAGASVEDILAKYPAHKAELEEMLGVVLMLEDVKLSEVPSEQLRAAFSPHDSLARSMSRTVAVLDFLLRPSVRMPAAVLAVLIIAVLAVNTVTAPAPSIQYQSGTEVTQLSPASGEDAIATRHELPVGGNTDSAGDYPAEGLNTSLAPAESTTMAAKSSAPIDSAAFDPNAIAATEAVLVFPQFESFVADEIALTSYEQELTQ
ncbi:MAG: hypothetical protein AAB343_00050 [Patescibacteria group bacterium]